MSLKRAIFVFLYLLLYTIGSVAQEHTESRLFNRFSFTFTTAYHRNPWHDYNRALETVTRRIELDNFFLYPSGSYEKINGDLTFRGEFGFRFIKKLRVLWTGQFGQLNSAFEFFPDTSVVPPEAGGSPAFHQKLDFRVRGIGLGFSYEFSFGQKLALLPQIALERYYGELDLAWRHSRFSRGPLPIDSGEQLSANLDDATWGLNLGIALNWKVHKNLSFLLGVDYRRAKFDQMRGQATYGFPFSNRFSPFEAELVQAENYFGARDTSENSLEKEFFLPPLTFLTEPRDEARERAIIDLNAFGLRTGIQLSF